MVHELMTILSVFAFCMGACIASFLNVVIWRVPRGESVVRPPSHCPKCNASIRWYQNVPILSWLALRGRCASCKAPISPRYICVEALGGILFTLAFWRFGLVAPLAWIWIALMIVGTFVDFDLQLLPDFVTVGGMAYGLLLALVETATGYPVSFCPDFGLPSVPLSVAGHAFAAAPLVGSVSGLCFGFGLLWLVRHFGTKAFKREAMGLGDVFLMGAVGALFGPSAVLLTLIVSSLSGAVVGLAMMLAAKAKLGSFTAIPFGPYICFGCLVWMLYGPETLNWYLSVLR